MSPSAEDCLFLLRLARSTIESVLEGEELPDLELGELPDDLRQPGASFITLTIRGALRGCIGSIEPRRPLARDVQENAIGAAFRDPRFPPLARGELAQVRIELSILTTPQPLTYDDPESLLAALRPNVDGVIIQRDWHRATFLPQVWEKLPQPRDFMAQLCMKAGLPHNDYENPGLDVQVYQVQKHEE
jgi:AmmeMemoRadiSam system protein A